MALATRVNRALRAFLTPPKPSIERTTTVEWGVIEETINRQVRTSNRRIRIVRLDDEYHTTSLEQWGRMIGADPTDQLIWEKDVHDCDDFAWAMRNVAVNVYGLTAMGFVNDHSARHAYNVFLADDLRMWFTEPDSDDWGMKTADEFPVDDRHQLNHVTLVI